MNEAVIDIQTGIKAVLAQQRRNFPVHANRISGLDDPCLRRLYYMRAAWDKQTPTDDGLQGIFSTGNILEPVIERIVSEVGLLSTPQWRIVGSQTQTRTDDSLFSKYQISGTVDGFLQMKVAGEQWFTVAVVDIKTMSPNVYARVETYDDLSRFPWTAKYRGQVMLYSLANNLERCALLLVNKSNLYDMRLIQFPLDLEYCEGLLRKAGTVNEALEAGTPPEGVNVPDICGKCPFLAFCAPPLTMTGNLQISADAELEDALNRLEELSTYADEIGDLEKLRDGRLTKGQDLVCGKWMIVWKKSVIHRKAQEASESESWRKTITKVEA